MHVAYDFAQDPMVGLWRGARDDDGRKRVNETTATVTTERNNGRKRNERCITYACIRCMSAGARATTATEVSMSRENSGPSGDVYTLIAFILLSAHTKRGLNDII